MSKLRLLTLVGVLAAALAPLSGCGSECAEGTSEEGGECVVAANGCADGTVLRNGQCLLDTDGCGAGTVFDEENDECVVAGEACDEGTSFDVEQGVCVPDAEVICGQGTEVGPDGSCVPSEAVCGDKTLMDDDGRCVVDAVNCGQGAELDPNTGECLLAEEACGQGTAFDADTGGCVPTEEVCEEGTEFDAASGMCLNDSCTRGDVLVDGVCTSPLVELAEDAEPEEENNDPALGGTANELIVHGVGGDAHVFSGVIGEPTDLDGDGTADQDIDVFEFEAESGDWFELTVHSTGLQAPAFVVEGPEGYRRTSPTGRSQDASRKIVVQQEGTYTVSVMPSMVLQSDGDIAGFGGDDWSYVGTLETLSPAGSTEVEVADGAGSISGDYIDLGDNLFEITGADDGDIVRVRVDDTGSQATGLMQDWSEGSEGAAPEEISEETYLDFTAGSDDALVFLDWISAVGHDTGFELKANVVGTSRSELVGADSSRTLTVGAQAGDYIVATQSNNEGVEMDVVISDPADEEVNSDTLAAGAELGVLAQSDGEYTVEFTNASEVDANANLEVAVVPIPQLGPLAAATPSDSVSQPTMVPEDATKMYRLTVDEIGDVALVAHATDGDPEVIVYDSAMEEVDASYSSGNKEELTLEDLEMGTYLVEVLANWELESYQLSAQLLVPQYFDEPGTSIPDDDPEGITGTIHVSGTGCTAIDTVTAFVDASTLAGDLVVELTSPMGTTVVLHDRSYPLTGVYGPSFPVDGPGTMADFAGEPADGPWELYVADMELYSTGTLDEWGLSFTCL